MARKIEPNEPTYEVGLKVGMFVGGRWAGGYKVNRKSRRCSKGVL